MRRHVWVGCLLALGAGDAIADDKPAVKETNSSEVRAALEKGWDKTHYGKEMDHREYGKILLALARSVAQESPAPLAGYTAEFVQVSVMKLAPGLPVDVVVQALLNPGKTFTWKQWEVSGGFATYEHRRAVGTEVPKVEIRWPKPIVRMEMKWAVVDLPNTYQPYVRVREKK